MSSQRPDRVREPPPLTTAQALRVLVQLRRADQIVITHQGSAREWPKLAQHPLDLHYLPSAMGAAIPLGLGLALAQPQREVLVVTGEGSLLMNLGALVTVTGSRASNITVVVLDNAAYAVTGGQQTPASAGQVDFAGLARAAGFPSVGHFRSLSLWEQQAPELLSLAGPRFVWLQVPAEKHQLPPKGLPLLRDRLARFAKALAAQPGER